MNVNMIHNSMACRYANFTISAWAQHLYYRTHGARERERARQERVDGWPDEWLDKERGGGCIVKKLHFYFRSFCMSEPTENCCKPADLTTVFSQRLNWDAIYRRYGKYVPSKLVFATPRLFTFAMLVVLVIHVFTYNQIDVSLDCLVLW